MILQTEWIIPNETKNIVQIFQWELTNLFFVILEIFLCELHAINVANNVKLNGKFVSVADMKNVRPEADKSCCR